MDGGPRARQSDRCDWERTRIFRGGRRRVIPLSLSLESLNLAQDLATEVRDF
jgi:hypothetical protein